MSAEASREATRQLVQAYGELDPQPPEDALRTGMISATRSRNVLVVSATHGCADDLEALLHAAMLAIPESLEPGFLL